MKRLGLSLSLAVGALVLFFSATTGSTPTVSAQPEDYCGVPGFDVPDSGSYFDFSQACQNHDNCYGAGGGIADRARCDQQFLKDMNASCAAMWPAHSFNLSLCRAHATKYYTGVRIGGWAFFYGNNR
jgi:hypothetical protein